MTSNSIVFAMPSLFHVGVSETKHTHSHTCAVWTYKVCMVYNWNINYKRVFKMLNNTYTKIPQQSTQNNFRNQHDWLAMHTLTHTHEHKYNRRLLNDLFINHRQSTETSCDFLLSIQCFLNFSFFSLHWIVWTTEFFSKFNMNTPAKLKSHSKFFHSIFSKLFVQSTLKSIYFILIVHTYHVNGIVHLFEANILAIKFIILSCESRLQ